MAYGITNANAVPLFNSATGHYYEVLGSTGTWGDYGSWDDYNNFANSQTYDGLQGHLATVTSLEESNWLASTFRWDNIRYHMLGATDSSEEGTWEWVTGEDWSYESWVGGEPNDMGEGEDYLMFWGSQGGWNDIPFFQTAYNNGFIIEYEAVQAVVPVPGAVWLFATSLMGFLAMRRKKQTL